MELKPSLSVASNRTTPQWRWPAQTFVSLSMCRCPSRSVRFQVQPWRRDKEAAATGRGPAQAATYACCRSPLARVSDILNNHEHLS
jgi:hypothetical protein